VANSLAVNNLLSAATQYPATVTLTTQTTGANTVTIKINGVDIVSSPQSVPCVAGPASIKSDLESTASLFPVLTFVVVRQLLVMAIEDPALLHVITMRSEVI